MRITALVEAMVAAGATPDMILVAVRATEAANEHAMEVSRNKTRARVAKWREKKVGNVTDGVVTVTNGSRAGDARVEDITSNSKIEPKKEEQKESALSREFDQFWTAYPNKVGKPKAREALAKARKVASLEAILSGLSRYVASKPADRAWLNPATFLNQERWADQPANVVPMARGSPLSMVDFLGDVIETQEQRYAGPDPEIESPSQALRAIPGGRWTG